MRKPKASGVVVRCIGCKARKLIPLARAAEIDSPPICEYCILPMLPEQAAAGASS